MSRSPVSEASPKRLRTVLVLVAQHVVCATTGSKRTERTYKLIIQVKIHYGIYHFLCGSNAVSMHELHRWSK
jgi:hypothetical protein